MQTQVLVLNADYSKINLVSWKRAYNLLEKGRAEAVKYTEQTVSNIDSTVKFKIPSVIKLVEFVKNIYKSKVRLSKRFIQIRDNKTCSYCGVKNQTMSIDHVIPISKGGETSWENCVCSCHKCNNRKADKTLAQAGMKLLIIPYAPTMMQFVKCKMRNLGIEFDF